MIQQIVGLLLGEWTTSALSILAFLLSLFSLIGCDLVRLNFSAINDLGIFFKQPSWFGIGLINHQNFDENKNSIMWEHNATCYNYDDLGIEMFRSSNLPSSLQMCAIACVLSIIVFFMVVAILCMKKSCFAARIFTILASLTSALLQLIAFLHAFSSTGGGVCDPSTYGNNWYESFPPFEYPKVRYMKFFSGCTMGATAQTLAASIAFQLLTLVWLSVNFVLAKKAEARAAEEVNEMKIAEKNTKDEQQMAFIDDGLPDEPEITYPVSTSRSRKVDIEEGVPVSPSGESSDMTEEVEGPDEEVVPLTTADDKEDEAAAAEEVDESNDIKEKEDVVDAQPKEEEEPKDDEAEQVAEAEEEEEVYSLYTTDVRAQAEATVGSVKIASMKSGRF
mmetsp:Transcript_17685/g.26501  ORF Transcript_17685/g.26501 Transcript_17685/m.26501 type:complete len:391 (+) Transcript_17685:181-1353(+)